MDSLSEYRKWCECASDEILKTELAALAGDTRQIEERFSSELKFGTAGLRGIIGAGSARMNIYTVARATQGLADYINGTLGGGAVAVSYDTRHCSELFAKTSARVLCANGIAVKLFGECAPTPLLSFAVRQFGCAAGIMITASHNPAKYNGYKVYGSDGCQMTTTAADMVFSCIEKIDTFTGVKSVAFEKALGDGQIEYIPERFFERYYDAVNSCRVRPAQSLAQLGIVYTPLHGTGKRHVMRLLQDAGAENVALVDEQAEPDGDFTTCEYPNPETTEALRRGLLLCEKTNADILIATDPDADRVGAAVKHGDGYRILCGNEMGALLFDYIAAGRSENGTLPQRAVAVRSVVSDSLCDDIARDAGVEMREVLTGFKYIGEQILLLEQQQSADDFIFGFEESCGFLAGSYVRDKDAMVAALLLCEMAAYYKQKHKTLVERLGELYEKYGYHKTVTLNFASEGIAGQQKIADTMQRLREHPPTELCGSEVLQTADFLSRRRVNSITGIESEISLPKADIVSWKLKNGAVVTIRPSGTEPKMKAYIIVKEPTEQQSEQLLDYLSVVVTKLLDL